MLLVHTDCIICGSTCDPIKCDEDDPLTTTTPIRDGGIVRLTFGYGSRLDTGFFYGVICDSCAKTFVETAASRLHAIRTNLENTLDVEDLNDDFPDALKRSC